MPEMIPQGQRADGPLVHRMVHKGDRPGFQGGSEWACPFCAHQVVFWPLHHQVMVSGAADAFHVRGTEEVPNHPQGSVLELTEADQATIAWTGVDWADGRFQP
jgi:hypothetical protein